MKSVYRVLAYVIAAEVVVQAAAIAFAVFGLSKWVEDGGTLTKAAMESEDTKFTGVLGFAIHGMNGTMLIPLVTLVFLVVSFFAKVPGGVRNAAVVLGLIVLQVALGLFGHENAYIGMLHGVNALVLFAAAMHTGRSAGKAEAATQEVPTAAAV